METTVEIVMQRWNKEIKQREEIRIYRTYKSCYAFAEVCDKTWKDKAVSLAINEGWCIRSVSITN